MKYLINLIRAINKRINYDRIMSPGDFIIQIPGLIIFPTVIRKSVTALVLCSLLIPLSRYISPSTTIDGIQIYLAYLPVSLIIAVTFIYGRVAIIPLIFSVIICSMIVRYYLGARWRHALTDKGMGVRIFWLGFVTPFSIKMLMYCAGHYIHFPAQAAAYFGDNSLMFMVVDFQSLIAVSLIFTVLFYSLHVIHDDDV